MKKLLFIILLFGMHSANAQKWAWGRQGTNQSDTYSSKITASDSKGNVFLCGYFLDTISFGSKHFGSFSGYFDSFLVKYDSLGNLLWAKQSISVSFVSGCYISSVATDKAGNVYVAGWFQDSVYLAPYFLIPQSWTNIFIAKYDTGGNLLWVDQSHTHSKHALDYCQTVTTDNAGNAYITGSFEDTISFGHDTLRCGLNGFEDMFIAKFDANGNELWAKQSITSWYDGDNIPTVGVDNTGNVYISGNFLDTTSFGSFKLIGPQSEAMVYLVKYDANGNEQWAKQSTVPSEHSGGNSYAVITDKVGNAYISGWFSDTLMFGRDTLIYNTPNGEYGAIFLVKYNPSGNVVWAKQSNQSYIKGGYGGFCGYSLASDTLNHIYLSAGSYTPGKGRIIFGKDTFLFDTTDRDPSLLLKLDTSGTVLCGTKICTGGDDNNSVSVNASGTCVYLAGDIYDTITFGKNKLKGYPSEPPFLARWLPCGMDCTLPYSLSGMPKLCQGNSEMLTATGGGAYLWSTGETTASININPSSTTVYTLTITNGGCSAKDSIRVRVFPYPVATYCCDSSILFGQQVDLFAGSGDSYSWSPDIGLNCDTCPNPVATPSVTTTYTLTISTDSGCSVTEFLTIDVSCGNVFVPDAFSPNRDGQNDILYVRGPCIKTMDFVIFDRWGNKVFETENQSTGWDGTYNRLPANTGTYVYYLHATMRDGSLVEKKGSVALVR